MELDMGWCLCGKQTSNPNGYCSTACELKDASPSKPTTSTLPLTSPLPTTLIPSPPLEHSANPTPRANNSPAQGFFHHPPPASAVNSSPPVALPGFRSRRAYSEAVVPTQAFPVFARKPSSVARPSITSPIPSGKPRLGFEKLAKSTGNNTPIVPESAFCSTSESSDNDAIETGYTSHSPVKPQLLNSVFNVPRSTHRPSLSTELVTGPTSRSTSLASQLPTARPNRHSSQSPVAALIAASASSRSREDIISWAAAVRERPPGDDSELEEERRPRRSQCPPLPPPTCTELLEEHEVESAATGTTPKARISLGSALNFTNVVKALKGVTSVNYPVPSKPRSPPPSSTFIGLGLQSVPAPAEVSRIAVVVGTTQTLDYEAPQSSHFNGGATPTMSTISFSEVVDPSVMTDNMEHVEVVNDDQSESFSSYRQHSVPIKPYRRPSLVSPVPPSRHLLSNTGAHSDVAPRRLIGSTIWNSISYLSSFSPFSIPGLGTANAEPKGEVSSVTNQSQSLSITSPKKKSPDPVRPTPLPAVTKVDSQGLKDTLDENTGATSDAENMLPREMVRSLPMDIIAMGGRSLARPVIENELPDERHRERIEPSRSPSLVEGESSTRQINSGTQWVYDASDEEEEVNSGSRGRGRGKSVGRRGRSRKGKKLNAGDGRRQSGMSDDLGIRNIKIQDLAITSSHSPPDGERERGRRRDRNAESREREFSVGRGRSGTRIARERGVRVG